MNIEDLKNKIAFLDVGDDNLGIALCCLFDDHINKPEDDLVDEEIGWGDWVIERSDDILERIVECVLNSLERPAEAPSKERLNSLIKVSHALTRFDYIIKQPRMDLDKQLREAVDSIIGVWDRETQKQFRVLINELNKEK